MHVQEEKARVHARVDAQLTRVVETEVAANVSGERADVVHEVAAVGHEASGARERRQEPDHNAVGITVGLGCV